MSNSPKPKTSPRSHRLRISRQSIDYGIYSITNVVEQRRPIIANRESTRILFDSWSYLRRVDRIKLYSFCVMPDHYHVIFCLMQGESLSKVMEDSSKFTAGQLNKLYRFQGRFWQKGFHDHQCRNSQEVIDLTTYIEHNPVRAGFVELAENWPFSSAWPAVRKQMDLEWFRLD